MQIAAMGLRSECKISRLQLLTEECSKREGGVLGVTSTKWLPAVSPNTDMHLFFASQFSPISSVPFYLFPEFQYLLQGFAKLAACS